MRFLIAAVIAGGITFTIIFIASRLDNWRGMRTLRRKTGRDVVIQDIYVERAKENYLLLDEVVDYLKTLVAADDVMATLTDTQRDKAERLIEKFDKYQLPKGK
jgi:hypothetical protein